MAKRHLNQTEAARELAITKQALSQYLREKSTPQSEILAKACAKWAITVRYRDREFKLAALGAVRTRTNPEALQLDLFREPQVFENAHMVDLMADGLLGNPIDQLFHLELHLRPFQPGKCFSQTLGNL